MNKIFFLVSLCFSYAEVSANPCCAKICGDITKVAECAKCKADTTKLPDCKDRTNDKPNLKVWMADIEESGTYCVLNGGNFKLWRENEREEITLTFKKTYSWENGKTLFNWQEQDFPFVDNVKYTVIFGDKESHFTFKIIPPELEGEDERKTWMNKQGCTIQAKRY